MWVRLNVIKYLDERGKSVTHYPGEWVQVGRQEAESWVVCGDASRPDMPDWDVLPGCGVVKTGEPRHPLTGLDQVTSSEPALTYPKTLVWSGVPFRQDLVAVGFKLLDMWELVIPLAEYDILATDVGTQVERDATRSIIRDLRVPVYDTRLMFVRRCATQGSFLACGTKTVAQTS